MTYAARRRARKPFDLSRLNASFQGSDVRFLQWAVLLGLVFGSYFMLRYQGYWAEIDTSVFLTAAEKYSYARTLTYDGAYLHGYAYVVWLTTLSDFTGLPIPDLTQLYLPIISTLMVALLGFAAFRQLLGSARLGLMSVAAVFLVPEFLFTVARGNHEKIDISMILLAILAMTSSMREWQTGHRPAVFASWALTYHLATFTLSTSNTFFGSTFAAASTLFVLGMLILTRLRARSSGTHGSLTRRLLLTLGVSWSLVMLVMWYLYPAASSQLQTYKDLISRLSTLFLSFDTNPSPYAAVRQEWASQLAYTVVSSFRWVMFGVSFALWAYLLWRAVRNFHEVSAQRLYLLGLYGGFGVLLGLSIPVDFMGLAEGNNLQVRLYTYFVLMAAPLFSLGLALLLRAARRWNFPRWLSPLLRVGLVVFALLSVLKATVDPAISNLWTFYTPQELRAVRFWANRNQYSTLWMGTRARLDYAFATRYGTFRPNQNYLLTGLADASTLMAVDSPVIRAQAAAERFELPTMFLTGNRVYDNGQAKLVSRLPQGPFNR